MKKWEYLLADFTDRKLYRINGEPVENFIDHEYRHALFPIFREPEDIPAQGTYITDFLKEAGESGWEVINFIEIYSRITILFKREVENKKKSTKSELESVSEGEDNMWKCEKCGEHIESDFEVCWNCGTEKKGV